MYSKLVLCLAVTVTVSVTLPAKLGDLGRQSFGANSFAKRTLGGLPSERNVRDLRGAYSFSFETPEGIKRQEEGKPKPPTGAVAQNGEWSLTYPDGREGFFKFVADDMGFRLLESEVITETPEHVIQLRQQRTEKRLQAAKDKAHQRAESCRVLSFAKPQTA